MNKKFLYFAIFSVFILDWKNKPNNVIFISVPPNKPVIRDANGRKMTKSLGPYKIGDKLFAACSTTGGA